MEWWLDHQHCSIVGRMPSRLLRKVDQGRVDAITVTLSQELGPRRSRNSLNPGLNEAPRPVSRKRL